MSATAFLVIWLPGLGKGRIKTLVRLTGIATFSLPWFWLPFTNQPRVAGSLCLALTIVGMLFFAFGMALAGMAGRLIHGVIGLGQVDPARLVKEGVYGFVRHPIYSGLTIGLLGWALLWGGVYATLLTAVLYLLLRLEEKLILERKFGATYVAYRNQVPAFFPPVLLIPLLFTAFVITLGVLLGSIPLTTLGSGA